MSKFKIKVVNSANISCWVKIHKNWTIPMIKVRFYTKTTQTLPQKLLIYCLV